MGTSGEHHGGDDGAAERLFPNQLPVFFVQAITKPVARAEVNMVMVQGRLTVHRVGHVKSPIRISGLNIYAQDRPSRVFVAGDEIAVAEAKENPIPGNGR